MTKILVADKLNSTVLDETRARENVELDVKLGLSEDELGEAVRDYDGLVIRSGVKVTAAVLAEPGRLKAVARAGVGVDNVDLDAATRAGVLVINTPDANTVSTAEHAFALMLAAARNIIPACMDTKAGNWDRSKYVGRQLAGKHLAIVGLGRIGRAVAERALAFKMTVSAYDPLYGGETAMDGRLVLAKDFNELLKDADFVTIHAALNDKTRDLISTDELKMMKPTAYIVNCARGGIVNEQALAEALKTNEIAGAALDVYTTEPPGQMPIFQCDNALTTCHLGASTTEAQLAVSADAMDGLLECLQHGTIRSAVNITGMPPSLSPLQTEYVDLARRMSVLIGMTVRAGIKSVRVVGVGSELEPILPLLLKSTLVELLSSYMETSINLVNADIQAKTTGIETSYAAKSESAPYHSLLRIEITDADGEHSIIGTTSSHGSPLVVKIDGYRMQMVPEGIMLMIINDDQPGAIGLVGTIFGQHGVNIADLTLARQQDHAMMLFKIDEPAPKEAIEQLKQTCPPIRHVVTAELPPIATDSQ